MVSIKVNNIRYYLDDKVAQDFSDSIDLEALIRAKTNVIVDCFSDPQLKNAEQVEVNYNILRRTKDRIEDDLKFLNIQNAQRFAEELEEKRLKAAQSKQTERSMKEERHTYLRRQISTTREVDHIERVQEKITAGVKLDKLKEHACKRIKNTYAQNIKQFECSNGIVMDGSLEDSENLAKGIAYCSRKKLKTILINDFNNNDHDVSLDDASLMVDEIEEHFYLCRDLKQELYNQVKNTSNGDDLVNIRFKL